MFKRPELSEIEKLRHKQRKDLLARVEGRLRALPEDPKPKPKPPGEIL